jgi:hypothetical protein
MPSVVDRIYQEFKDLEEYLSQAMERGHDPQITLLTTANENFRKTLLLAAASYFEDQITGCLKQFIEERSNSLVSAFTANKAIHRQYHTFFDWNSNNANQFFGLLGEQFRAYMRSAIAGDTALEDSIAAFITLGRERNVLLHGNYGLQTLNKTADEIYDTYQKAGKFVHGLPDRLKDCVDNAS